MRKLGLRQLSLAVVVFASLNVGLLRADDSTKLLPKDTEVVVTVKMKEILEAPLVKKYALEHLQQFLADNKEAKEMFAATGLDPMKDLGKFTLGLSGNSPEDMKISMVLDGKFDASKINEAVKSEAKKKGEKLGVSDVGGKTVFEMPSKDGPIQNMYMSVISDKQIVVGSKKDFVADAITGKTTGAVKALADLVSASDSKTMISVAAIMTKAKLDMINDKITEEQPKAVLSKVESVVFEIKADKDIDVSIAIASKSATDAKACFDLVSMGVDQMKALLPIFAGQAPPQAKPLIKTLNATSISQKDKLTTIGMIVTEEQIKEMLKQ